MNLSLTTAAAAAPALPSLVPQPDGARSPYAVRALSPRDVAGVLAVQDVCYGAYYSEPRAVWEQRLRAEGHCSLGVVLVPARHTTCCDGGDGSNACNSDCDCVSNNSNSSSSSGSSSSSQTATAAEAADAAEAAELLQAYLAAYWSTEGKITPLNGEFKPHSVNSPVGATVSNENDSSRSADGYKDNDDYDGTAVAETCNAGAPPSSPQPVLYLHDMSVLPAHAGRGIASHLLRLLLAEARAKGLARAALVSVQGSQAYWERQGFRVAEVTDAEQRRNLESYGEGAVYMVADLTPCEATKGQEHGQTSAKTLSK